MNATLLHYSVPALPRHEGQTPSLADAEELAQRAANRTGERAEIRAHYAVDGVEEIRHLRWVSR